MERDSDEMVYEKYADELIRFATALVGPSDAADILSMAVLRVFASRGWPNVTTNARTSRARCSMKRE